MIYRFIVTGTLSNNAYIMKFYQSMFDSLTNFIPATWTLNVLASGIEEITSTANLSLTLSSQTVSNPPYTIQSLTYNQVSTSTSDEFLQILDQSYSIVENRFIQVTPDLTCSASGSTSISYTISNYMASTAPAWVVIDSSTGMINVTAPTVSTDTEFVFYIDSNIAGFSKLIKKLIKITILDCKASN